MRWGPGVSKWTRPLVQGERKGCRWRQRSGPQNGSSPRRLGNALWRVCVCVTSEGDPESEPVFNDDENGVRWGLGLGSVAEPRAGRERLRERLLCFALRDETVSECKADDEKRESVCVCACLRTLLFGLIELLGLNGIAKRPASKRDSKRGQCACTCTR